MTKRELKSMGNERLVDHFDFICTKLTHEVNSTRGQTKKTVDDYEMTKAELLQRMETWKKDITLL